MPQGLEPASVRYSINPFDQPDVEASKIKTRELSATFEKTGALPPEKPVYSTRFIDVFADAVDVIVRGIKAGLPLFESLKVVAADSPEPLRSEFKAIIETQAIGMPLGEACGRLFERMPVPEANFFGIVISIQQKSGGNLSEALGNLSKVLRDRKKMAEKIQAMSMEAKASAGIIGSLPPIEMVLVYITTPDYI